MSNATHTPGPWSVSFGATDCRWPQVDGADKTLIARTYGPRDEADAALIAQAPTLLAQLAAVTAQRDQLRAALESAAVSMESEVVILTDHDPEYGDGVFIASTEHLTCAVMSARAALLACAEGGAR